MNIPPKYEDVVANLDAALGREAALRESLTDKREEYNKLGDRYDALQQRMTVAEQRAADLKKLLCDVINEAPTGFASLKVDLANRVNDALNPAEHPQCEECKGWGYHENHHEGGGTECGECGGSGNAPVAVVMPERESFEIRDWAGSFCQEALSFGLSEDSFSRCIRTTIDRTLAEVARLNVVKP